MKLIDPEKGQKVRIYSRHLKGYDVYFAGGAKKTLTVMGYSRQYDTVCVWDGNSPAIIISRSKLRLATSREI